MMTDPHELGYGEIEIPDLPLGQHLGQTAQSAGDAVGSVAVAPVGVMGCVWYV